MKKQTKTEIKGDQSARFIEAAKQVGADQTGKVFDRAMGKVIAAKKKATKSR